MRLPGARQRRLVSLLLVDADRVVQAGRLAEQLDLSHGALRTSISRLRRLLGEDVIVTDGGGYSIRPRELDVRAFDDLVSRAGSARDLGDRVTHLRAALGLWRGDAYAEFAPNEGFRWEIQRLNELRANAQEQLAVSLIELGDQTGAIAALDRLLVAEPYRDRPRELAMRALADSGRRVDALRLFQEYRRTLDRDVGTEPSAQIVELERTIAAQSTSEPRRDSSLPAPTSSFVGRADEQIAIGRLVIAHRLVTLVGAGGAGKSRIAVRVARDHIAIHPGGTWFADLSRISMPDSVADEIGQSTGAPVSGTDAVRAVEERINAVGPCLIVLDNAEHVLPGVVAVVDALLRRCPDVRLLVTSREPLDVPGEAVYRLPSMACPPLGASVEPGVLDQYDATALFVERMRDARPGVVLDADMAAQVSSICAGLDGLPLAIEIAAARTRALSLGWIDTGVKTAAAILESSPTPGARHQSIRASIAWSVDLLDRFDREALGRLSVFRSPFTVQAAAAVVFEIEPRIDAMLPVLVRLCDKSLVQFDAHTGRYRLLETIRQYCATALLDSERWAEVSSRHCARFARWCSDVGDGRHGIERTAVLAEMPDVVAAMEWAKHHDPDRAMQMCVGLASIRTTLGYFENLSATWRWLTGPDAPPRSPLWAAAVAALMSAATGAGLEVDAIVPEVERHLPPSDERAWGWLTRGRAMVPAYRGDLTPAIDYAISVLDRGDDVEAAVYVGFTAYMLALGGRLPEAGAMLHQLHQLVGRHSAAFSVDTVGNGFAAEVLVAAVEGRLQDAMTAGRQPGPQDPAFSMTAAAALAHVALLSNDRRALDRALDWARRGSIPVLRYLTTELDLYRALVRGDGGAAASAAEAYWAQAAPVPMSRIHLLSLLVFALIADGRHRTASAMASEAEDIVGGMPAVPLLDAVVVHSRAQLAHAAGRTSDQVKHATVMLELAERHGFAVLMIDAKENLALALDHSGDRAAVEDLLVAAHSARERIGYRFAASVPRSDLHAIRRRVLGEERDAGVVPIEP